MNEAALLINEYENALQLAAQRYTLTKADYQAGRTTISQLLEAQTQLFQAQNNLTDAFISYRIAERKFLNYQH
jgi:outer membrane protein TolC